MKKCPFCAEEILDDAIKCKHCSSRLEASPAVHSDTRAERTNSSFSLVGFFGALVAVAGLIFGLTVATTSPLLAVFGIVLLIVGASIGAKYK